jgi:hypothetical protein
MSACGRLCCKSRFAPKIDELRKHYSEDEIVELGTFIGFNLGYHTFFGTLKFYPLFSPDGRLVSQSESEKLYGPAPTSLKPEAAE